MISQKFSQVVFKVSDDFDSPQNHQSCSLDFIPKNVAKSWVRRLTEMGAYGICLGDFPDREHCKILFWASPEIIETIRIAFPSNPIIKQLSLF
jgi:hypothetical protein